MAIHPKTTEDILSEKSVTQEAYSYLLFASFAAVLTVRGDNFPGGFTLE